MQATAAQHLRMHVPGVGTSSPGSPRLRLPGSRRETRTEMVCEGLPLTGCNGELVGQRASSTCERGGAGVADILCERLPRHQRNRRLAQEQLACREGGDRLRVTTIIQPGYNAYLRNHVLLCFINFFLIIFHHTSVV